MIFLSIIYGIVLINSISTYKLTNSKNTKIIGRTEAENENYFVSIRIKSIEEKSYGQGHICGGTLIHDGSVVLTAGHCLFYPVHGVALRYKPDELITVVGSDRLTDPKDAKIHQVIKIDIHENYTETYTKNQNDLALLWLNGSALSENIDVEVIDLINKTVEPNDICKISGFGTLLSVRLNKTTIKNPT